MPRNLCERVFPLKDQSLRQRGMDEILLNYLRDTGKARFLGNNGSYTRVHTNGSRPRNGARFNVQDCFVSLAEERLEIDLETVPQPPPLAMSAE
jgi:polyphosphate kinase